MMIRRMPASWRLRAWLQGPMRTISAIGPFANSTGGPGRVGDVTLTMAKAKKKVAPGDVATNRQASHRFELLDRLECGVVLQGTEVKALRDGSAQIKDAYAQVRDGELWLHNVHIPPYAPAARDNHEPERPRKLLAHRREIERLVDKQHERGLTIVPTAHLLQGPARKGRDRARHGQGPLRQARGDQGARDQARHAARAAGSEQVTSRG